MKGDLYIYKNGNTPPSVPFDPSEWLDVWDNWGVGLEGDEAYEALMTFRPNKEPIVNKNVTVNGAYYVTGAGIVDERTVTVPFHIVAFDKTDFLMKREGFYKAIQGGLIRFKIMNPVEAEYQFYYLSCSQYTQFFSGMAKFMLTLYETNGCHDGDAATVTEEPWVTNGMEAYIDGILTDHGATIASEEDVRNIVQINW